MAAMAAQPEHIKCEGCRILKPTNSIRDTHAYKFVNVSKDDLTISGDPCMSAITIGAVANRSAECRTEWAKSNDGFKKSGGLALKAGSAQHRVQWQ